MHHGNCDKLNTKSVAELRSVTCRTWLHSFTSHPTQVYAPCLNPSWSGQSQWTQTWKTWNTLGIFWTCTRLRICTTL